MSTIHVMPNRAGGWDVTEGQSPARLAHFAQQGQAIAFGRLRTQPSGGALLVHHKVLSLAPHGRLRRELHPEFSGV